jgi:uncharacterized phage protein (TIGR01671 family)
MRELKVRAWYKPYKQMCQVESLRFDGNGVYTAVLIEEPFYDRKLVEADEIVIEQYTGLKDKNGTEIYEGDICSFTSKTGKHVGTVEWTDDLAGFGLRMVKNNFLYTFSELDTMGVNLDMLEVIGNVHKDSELAEKNENL